MKLCGLTGGVGMGKSTAAGFFLQHEARVVDTDALAHQLVRPGQPALAEIRSSFGESVINSSGGLRRDLLAQIVFSSAAARERLEAILHPRIRAAWLAQVEVWRAENNFKVGLVVIPLLFETHAENYFDDLICVACSPSTQRKRLAGRGWSSEQISQRIAAQLPIGEKMARSQFVLWTEGGLNAHEQQVLLLLRRLGAA
jgi:dephospho-CoA kinase